MTTGELIRKARKAAGLTQIELAREIGMSVNTIRLYEGGKVVPKLEAIKKIAESTKANASTLIAPENLKFFDALIGATTATKTIGETIKLARCAAGLTQKELGEKCGLDEANVRKYESGRQNPKLLLRLRLAAVLGIALSDLMSPEECELLGSIENSKTGGTNHETKRVLRGQCPAAERVFPQQGAIERGRRCQVRRARPAHRQKALSVYAKRYHSGNACACAVP